VKVNNLIKNLLLDIL